MPEIFSYLRFSRPEQIKGDSRRRQTVNIKRFAESKGLLVNESLSLEDLGVSAFRGKNLREGALGRFLECIQTGRVKPGDYLVIESLDRFSRAPPMGIAIPAIQSINNAGVTIVTLEPLTEYPPGSLEDMGTCFSMLIGLFAAHRESANKSMRLLEMWGNKRAKATEKILTRIAPHWLRVEGA